MAEEVDWEDPGRNPLVTANLTLQSFEEYIGPNCTDDCSVAATKFLGYLRGTQDILNQTHSEKWDEDWDIPIYQLDNFIWYCTDENFPNYTLGQAADWFTNNANERPRLDHLVNHTINACPTEFCKSLIWEGNPDVSGIGVNVAFVVQAVLASLLLLFYIGFYITDIVHLNSEQAYPEQDNRSPADSQHDTPQQHEQTTAQKPTKLLDPNALRETADHCLEVFWSTCYVFTFTFVIAALVINVDDTNRSAGRIYSGYFGYLGAVHFIAVLICLWPWFPGRHKYLALTFSGLLVLLCMMAAVSITFFHEAKLTAKKTTFESRCLEAGQSTHYVQYLVKYTPYAVFALILFWGGSLLVIRILTPKMTDQGKHTVLTLYLVLTGIFGGFLVLTSLILVWVSLGFFMYLRQRVAGLSGPSYKENEWGFSQVAAVVAWVPFLGQFSVIVICGLANLFFVDGAKELFKPVPKDQRGTARLLAQALHNKRYNREQQHGSMPAEAVPLSSIQSTTHDVEAVGTTSAGTGSHVQ